MSFQPDYLFEGEPAPGETWDVPGGLRWVRMPLPFKLNHINLWMVPEDGGWALIDTGINTVETRSAWDQIFAALPKNETVTRIIVTHFHPDHIGLAGWLCDRFRVSLWMPFAEWSMGRMLAEETHGAKTAFFREFYRQAGFEGAQLEAVDQRVGGYASKITPIPGQIHRLHDGETLRLGDNEWQVITGGGHSPDHAALYCAALNVLISGDQVLPKISTNVSVWPHEPEADPLFWYIKSLDKFRHLPTDTLVLPSHNWPFRGLLERLDDLVQHHQERLDETLAACVEPRRATEVLKVLFHRPLDDHQLFFAIGETLAHLHRLWRDDLLRRERDRDGVYLFQRAADTD